MIERIFATLTLFFILMPCQASFAVEAAVSSASTVESTPSVFALASPGFKEGEAIPDRYTCRGSDINPPLIISNIPQGTRAMALTVHDPDGLAGAWVHWVVFNIPPDTLAVKEKTVLGTEALNDFGNFYYGGPCPPDQKLHHYIFTLYALNVFLDSVNEGATKDTLEKAMAGKIIAKAALTGVYQNVNWK